jgi:hypothetical protein
MYCIKECSAHNHKACAPKRQQLTEGAAGRPSGKERGQLHDAVLTGVGLPWAHLLWDGLRVQPRVAHHSMPGPLQGIPNIKLWSGTRNTTKPGTDTWLRIPFHSWMCGLQPTIRIPTTTHTDNAEEGFHGPPKQSAPTTKALDADGSNKQRPGASGPSLHTLYEYACSSLQTLRGTRFTRSRDTRNVAQHTTPKLWHCGHAQKRGQGQGQRTDGRRQWGSTSSAQLGQVCR